MSHPLLSLERVTKRFNGIPAVEEVSFTVDRGEVVGFLGPNGAGKSTTMRVITQFYEPDSGSVRLDGVPLAEAAREAKRRLGFLPENNPLYTEMLASEYLDFVARLRQLPGGRGARRRAIDDAVAATAIESVFNRPIAELSKGFRQRVGLAAAILHRPDLLVLDEPTEGLDPNQRLDIRKLIAELGRERTVILSTHVLSEVQHTCSRVIIINRGRIAADGPVDELMARAAHGSRVHVEIRGHDVVPALGALPGVEHVEIRGGDASSPSSSAAASVAGSAASAAGPDALPDVQRAEREGGDAADGHTRATLFVAGERDVRGDVFELAKQKGWTLLELHRDAGSLEDLFRELTVIGATEAEPVPEAEPAQEAERAQEVEPAA